MNQTTYHSWKEQLSSHVQWMKAQSHQSRTVNPCLFKCMYSSCTSYVCLMCMCVWVGGYMGLGGGGGGGAGGMSGGDLRPPSHVICIKSHEL